MNSWWTADEQLMNWWWTDDELMMNSWSGLVCQRLPQTTTDCHWLIGSTPLNTQKLSPGMDGWDGIYPWLHQLQEHRTGLPLKFPSVNWSPPKSSNLKHCVLLRLHTFPCQGKFETLSKSTLLNKQLSVFEKLWYIGTITVEILSCWAVITTASHFSCLAFRKASNPYLNHFQI